MIDYKTTYTLPPPDDTNALTPKQERNFVKKINEAMDRAMVRALTGDYYVPSPGGLTLEHVPRRPQLEKKP